VIFYNTKSCSPLYLCEVNYVISSITMYNIWCLLWYIIHKNCKWRLGNDAYVLLCNMCHYLVSNCNFCVPYVTINITCCNEWNPTIYLTQMSWAMVFCAIKVTFSCSEWMVHWWLLLLFVPGLMTLNLLWRLQGSAGRVTCVGLVTDLFMNSYDFVQVEPYLRGIFIFFIDLPFFRILDDPPCDFLDNPIHPKNLASIYVQ
jgi:hypothetical protein